MIMFTHTYQDITSIVNLLKAWKEFIKGKRNKRDVQEFQYNLMSNILKRHSELKEMTYTHSTYEHFKINDPKPRDIHKATVRDRLVHHLLYQALYTFYDHTFISDSYSCRKNKGTHRALNRFRSFAYKVSRNNTRTCWVLKCDIRKFFASIDQETLLQILHSRIRDKNILTLIQNIVSSFHSTTEGKGLPLGNLTSQLLVNIYMNEFDQFIKHKLKVPYYIRYADDFVILSHEKSVIETLLLKMRIFLNEKLKLELHPSKVSITTPASGVDFLGWVHFFDHRVLRTSTKRRMFRNITVTNGKREVMDSYLGLLGLGNGWKLQQNIGKILL